MNGKTQFVWEFFLKCELNNSVFDEENPVVLLKLMWQSLLQLENRRFSKIRVMKLCEKKSRFAGQKKENLINYADELSADFQNHGIPA